MLTGWGEGPCYATRSLCGIKQLSFTLDVQHAVTGVSSVCVCVYLVDTS